MTYLSWNKNAGNLRTWPSHLLGCLGREGMGESTSLWALMMPCRLGCGPHQMFSGTRQTRALWTLTNNSANGTMIILPPSQKLCLAIFLCHSQPQQRQGNTQKEFLQSTTFRHMSVATCTQNLGSIFISITGTAPCYIDSLFFRALLLNWLL